MKKKLQEVAVYRGDHPRRVGTAPLTQDPRPATTDTLHVIAGRIKGKRRGKVARFVRPPMWLLKGKRPA